MGRKRIVAAALLLALCVALSACEKGDPVYVQSVKTLTDLGGIAPGDYFSGMVVSEHVTEIKKDSEKTIAELLVKEGDDVKKDDPLFSYDTDELQLALDRQKLELDQLQATIETNERKIRQLEQERNASSGTTKLQYTIEIQSAQVDIKEAEIKLKTKEAEVEKSQNLLENATILSPTTGRIQAINEEGTGSDGKPAPYITIQEMGSYRVKGLLGELQRGSLMAEQRVVLRSRVRENESWGGTITLVDYENPSQGSSYDMMYGNAGDEMSNSSKYPFYVALDSTEGLMLGQHLYIYLEGGENPSGLQLGSSFIVRNEDGSAYVWAEKGKKLEKRIVTLGDYDEMLDTYEILGGLTVDDYIAFPQEGLCVPGAPTTHDQELAAQPEEVYPEIDGGMMDEGMEMGDMPMDLPAVVEESPMEETPMDEIPADEAPMEESLLPEASPAAPEGGGQG